MKLIESFIMSIVAIISMAASWFFIMTFTILLLTIVFIIGIIQDSYTYIKIKIFNLRTSK